MRKRIAVIGKDTSLLDSLQKAAGDELDVLPLKPRKPLPVNTVALAGDGADAKALVNAALGLANHYEILLLLIAESIDAREGLPVGASQRVLDCATRFARALDLNAEDTLALQRGALLRDLGKLRISNEVLLKRNLLTYDEWALIRAHAHLGADMVATLPEVKDLEPVIRYHHENFDGTGYPDKLESDAIPYLARMLRIVDVYCAMTGQRHYRPTVSSHADAIEHLRAEQGKHFDAPLVDAFIERDVADAG
jgi:HD-GYP domain-containing protein (c-di-GMP phosphodiesterase class II)